MKNFSVVQRLWVLSLLPCAVLAAVLVVSATGLGRVYSATEALYERQITPITHLKLVADAYAVNIVDAVNKANIGAMTPAEARRSIDQAAAAIERAWRDYHASLSEDDARMHAEVDAMKPLFDAADGAVGDTRRALGELQGSGQGRLGEVAARLYASVDPVSERLAGLIAAHLEQAGEEKARASDFHHWLNTVMLVGGLLAIAATLAAAWGVSRSISAPLAQLQRVVQRIESERDLGLPLPALGRDEIGALGAALAGLLDGFRGVVEQASHSADTLLAQARRLEQTAQQVRSDAGSQSRETDQVATATTEMTHAIEEVGRSAQSAADAASRANLETRRGSDVLAQASGATRQLSQDLAATTALVRQVEQNSQTIGGVLDVIRGIAEQTNLLALNAAIEAARAGEQGRGFAVVADEVRSLASRTQQSTREIEDMIASLQAGTRAAAAAMEKGREAAQDSCEQVDAASQGLAEVAGLINTINDMNGQIAAATEEQMAVSQEVARNVVNISDLGRSAAESTASVERASGELLQLATALQRVVSAFRV